MVQPMNNNLHPPKPGHQRETFWAVWSVVAAFGTYFCMYGFRKPFTAASYDESFFWGIDFKTIAVTVQVLGYMLSKFVGIKVISEMPPRRRAVAVLVLIAVAQIGLVFFGLLERPWNVLGLFLNGLALGMVFGLVLGFLEGRRLTEALVAGLCASFILADGVTKSVGTWLLDTGVAEDWMPFTAGLIFLLPLCVCVAMLARIPAPSPEDIKARSARHTMSGSERWAFYRRYAGGLSLLVAVYLLITLIRSIRADFAPELWEGLGKPAAASTFTRSEMYVALGVVLVSGLVVCLRNNRLAFFVSLATCAAGFLVVATALVSQQTGELSAFGFMVLIGFGLYVPYVTLHTTVFERMLAMTRERGNIGFLMYVADAFGYLGYVVVMLTRNLYTAPGAVLPFFVMLCWLAVGLSLACLAFVWVYFSAHQTQPVVQLETGQAI